MPRQPVTALAMHPIVMDEMLRPDHIERLQRACRLVSLEPVRDFVQLGNAAARVEVLVTSWGCQRLDAEALAMFPQLRLIAHLAGSVKGFVDPMAWEHGVAVVNAVAANAVPVAEYTLAAILFANKRVFRLQQFYRAHHENRAPWTREAPNVGNYRKRIGIVGASTVGRRVIDLLQPFDFSIDLYDPWVAHSEARRMGVTKRDLDALLADADVVSLHAPLLPDTRHMLGARELRLMPDGATLINTARGALVDQDALVAELSSGRLSAVLDTTEPEVLPDDSILYHLPNVFLTPHIAGSLGTEVQRMSDDILDELERYSRSRPLQFRVAAEALPRLA